MDVTTQDQFIATNIRCPDADRHAKLLIHFAVEGSLLDAYSHPDHPSVEFRQLHCRFPIGDGACSEAKSLPEAEAVSSCSVGGAIRQNRSSSMFFFLTRRVSRAWRQFRSPGSRTRWPPAPRRPPVTQEYSLRQAPRSPRPNVTCGDNGLRPFFNSGFGAHNHRFRVGRGATCSFDLAIWLTECPARKSRKHLGCRLTPLAARSARSSIKVRRPVI